MRLYVKIGIYFTLKWFLLNVGNVLLGDELQIDAKIQILKFVRNRYEMKSVSMPLDGANVGM